MTSNFLLCSADDSQLEWLQSALANTGQVVRTGTNLEELMRLVDMMTVTLVFVSVERQHQVQQCGLIEGLLEQRPMVTVVALGDGYDSELVIATMRAGARDFITVGQRASEVSGLARRHLTRLPRLPAHDGDQASVAVLYGAQADADASLLMTHLALDLAHSGEDVLLIDLGLPAGESVGILGLESSFHFSDAVRNLRRLDATVIESAFPRHSSGLTVLSLSDEPFSLASLNSAELFLLLGSLKPHFGRILINLCGQPDSSVVRTLVGGAEKLLIHVDQSVSGSRRSLATLKAWGEQGIKLDHGMLVVDRYIDGVVPNDATLEKSFGMPLLATLPLSTRERLQSRNRGVDLFKLAPGNPLTKALLRLTRDFGVKASRKRTLWQRLKEFG